MEIIRVVKEVINGFNASNIIDDLLIIKDETREIDSIHREHNQGYLAFVQVLNINPDFSGKDSVVLSIGVSGVSSDADDDYLQVVSKSAYVIKTAMTHVGYAKDNNISDASFVVDATREGNVIKTLVYTTITVDIDLAYGS